MYPSSNSSSSQGSMGPTSTGAAGGGLMRYGSAPSSLLSTAVDSVTGGTREFSAHSHLAPPGTIQNDGASRANNRSREESGHVTIGLQRSYGFGAGGGSSGAGDGVGGSPSLVRHSSSPAGFLNQLTAAAGDNGFSITRGMGNYNSKGISDPGRGISRLNSQLSFTRQEALSQISEEADHENIGTENGQRKLTHSYAGAGFGIGSWDDGTNPQMFSMGQNKRPKNIGSDIVNGIDGMESQFHFSLPHEMSNMEKLMNIPQDSVPCKIRAKRGCATHPRSIAERERRTRISGKLKKLQILVPNMDKQTSYSDMLDLAVQHIKSLQNQVQHLNTELDNCTCGCKNSTDS